jgi:hypothetical protein
MKHMKLHENQGPRDRYLDESTDGQDYADFFGGRAGRKSQVAGRESTSLIATT